MSRLKIMKPEEAGGDVKRTYEAIKSKFGMVPNLIQALGNSPVALKAYTTLDAIISEGRLTGPEREIVRLVVSEVNGCTYCVAAHTLAGRAAGLSAEELINIRQYASDNPQHAALAAFTRAVVEKKGFLTDQEIENFRRAGYNDSDIGEVLAIVAQKALSNFFNHIHQTELDFPPAPPVGVRAHL